MQARPDRVVERTEGDDHGRGEHPRRGPAPLGGTSERERPEEIKAVERAWAELLADIRAKGVDLDPASPEARDLARRWQELVDRTFGGDRLLMAATAQGYREGRFADLEGPPRPRDFSFIDQVVAASQSEQGAKP